MFRSRLKIAAVAFVIAIIPTAAFAQQPSSRELFATYQRLGGSDNGPLNGAGIGVVFGQDRTVARLVTLSVARRDDERRYPNGGLGETERRTRQTLMQVAGGARVHSGKGRARVFGQALLGLRYRSQTDWIDYGPPDPLVTVSSRRLTASNHSTYPALMLGVGLTMALSRRVGVTGSFEGGLAGWGGEGVSVVSSVGLTYFLGAR